MNGFHELSIVVPCAYEDRMDDIIHSVSLLIEFNPNSVIMVIIDRNEYLYKQLSKHKIINNQIVKLTLMRISTGLSSVRNFAVNNCNTKYIAFIDDDALPTRNWAKNLLTTMDRYDDAIGAGGPILKLMSISQSRTLPYPLLWIWGCTYFLFNNSKIIKVTNNFGSNMIFETQKLIHFKFPEDLASTKFSHQGGEELYICQKLKKKFNGHVYFNPKAIVYHRIYNKRYHLPYIFNRIYYEAVSKSRLKHKYSMSSPNSNELLRILSLHYLPFLFSKLIKLQNIRQVFYELGILTMFSIFSLIGLIKGRNTY